MQALVARISVTQDAKVYLYTAFQCCILELLRTRVPQLDIELARQHGVGVVL
jgi:hypothetical protein